MLVARGLIKPRRKVGSRVQPRDEWNFLDRDVLAWHEAAMSQHEFLISVQQVRFMLEPEAAFLAAVNRTQDQLAAMENALREMERTQGTAERIEPDVHFHLSVLAATGNELLAPFRVSDHVSVGSAVQVYRRT